MTLTAKSSRGTQLPGAHNVVSFTTWSSNQVLTVNAGGKKTPCFTWGGEKRELFGNTPEHSVFLNKICSQELTI